jgi:LPS sulfotransferase NodH
VSGPPARSREELLQLFASYFGQDEVDAVRAQLALKRRGSFTAPQHILIILFASRAGSNFFGQLLCGTGWFREIGESFAPHQLTKIRERYCLKDLHAAGQWMIDNRGTTRAFGIKAGYSVLISAAELDFLPDVIDRAHFLLLRRRDRVAQAVSGFKKQLTGRTHSLQPAGRPLTDACYDAGAISAQVERIKLREAQYEQLLRDLGKTAPIHYYEDICAEPERRVAEVCRTMGLDMPANYEPHSKVRLSVLRDDVSERWVERFRTEHADH